MSVEGRLSQYKEDVRGRIARKSAGYRAESDASQDVWQRLVLNAKAEALDDILQEI